MSQTVIEAPSFNDAVQALLARVECRRITSPVERLEAYALRYACYLREGAIAPSANKYVHDRYDDLPNHHLFGCFVDGQLASTIRLGLGSAACRDIPANAVFEDVLSPHFAAGKRILDPTRFVIDGAFARLYPKLAYVTLRVAWLATEYFDVDYTLASVRAEHQAFYRRFYGHRLLCPPRHYLNLSKPLSLMLLDFKPMRERGLRRYPFLRSTECERSILLEETTPVPQRIAS